jgi:hypothetical protein
VGGFVWVSDDWVEGEIMGLSGGGVKDGWAPFSIVSFAIPPRRLKEWPPNMKSCLVFGSCHGD